GRRTLYSIAFRNSQPSRNMENSVLIQCNAVQNSVLIPFFSGRCWISSAFVPANFQPHTHPPTAAARASNPSGGAEGPATLWAPMLAGAKVMAAVNTYICSSSAGGQPASRESIDAKHRQDDDDDPQPSDECVDLTSRSVPKLPTR